MGSKMISRTGYLEQSTIKKYNVYSFFQTTDRSIFGHVDDDLDSLVSGTVNTTTGSSLGKARVQVIKDPWLKGEII